jgi:hypothetical protein
MFPGFPIPQSFYEKLLLLSTVWCQWTHRPGMIVMGSQKNQGIDNTTKNVQAYGILRTVTMYHDIQNLALLSTPTGHIRNNILFRLPGNIKRGMK